MDRNGPEWASITGMDFKIHPKIHVLIELDKKFCLSNVTYQLSSVPRLLLYSLLYIYQRTLEETGKRGQETYYLKSCLQLSCCLAFHRLLECTGIKVCLITSLLVKPSSSRTLLVQTPQLTFVSRNRIPDISLHSSSPYDKGPHPR